MLKGWWMQEIFGEDLLPGIGVRLNKDEEKLLRMTIFQEQLDRCDKMRIRFFRSGEAPRICISNKDSM